MNFSCTSMLIDLLKSRFLLYFMFTVQYDFPYLKKGYSSKCARIPYLLNGFSLLNHLHFPLHYVSFCTQFIIHFSVINYMFYNTVGVQWFDSWASNSAFCCCGDIYPSKCVIAKCKLHITQIHLHLCAATFVSCVYQCLISNRTHWNGVPAPPKKMFKNFWHNVLKEIVPFVVLTSSSSGRM